MIHRIFGIRNKFKHFYAPAGTGLTFCDNAGQAHSPLHPSSPLTVRTCLYGGCRTSVRRPPHPHPCTCRQGPPRCNMLTKQCRCRLRETKKDETSAAPTSHPIIQSFFLFEEPLVGFEPTTPRLQITCSGQLS